jgi:hypothetical protein
LNRFHIQRGRQKSGDRSLNGGSRILDSGFWMLPKPRRGKDRMVKVMVSGLDGLLPK